MQSEELIQESTTAAASSTFKWIRSEKISSLKLVVEEYRHRVTGAVHFHFRSDNPENVFLVAFRTVPSDSTGVAHILEHTTLCGSEKYPVRDPFFMMIRRSLNTFMNAFTSSDWTAYPFASKNRKDYFNLLDVYLDAVFFSRLHELDFAQEGHRLEFSEPENPESQLQIKGVVYNEMKGAMSSTNSVLWQTISENLFPTTTYHYNSGGDPASIPMLSYQDLLSFYKVHYHPSNAIFMTFGDIPAAELQNRIEKTALNRFQHLDVHIAVNDEKRYPAPRRIEEFYSCEDEGKDRTHVVMAWLLGKSIDLKDLYRAQLLNIVLLDNSASPLMRALETTDLGASPSPMCGLEDSNREMSFLCGLEGCSADTTDKVEALIIQTLQQIMENGVPEEQVEAALHQLELHQREITGDSYPYGLQLILTGLPTAIHRGDPIALLDIDSALAELREAIKDPAFIPELLQNLLLDNRHRLTLTLSPDSKLAARQQQEERDYIENLQASFTPEFEARIIARSRELAERQNQEDDPDILPKVGLEDIPETIEQPAARKTSLPKSGAAVSFYGQGTNGIGYQQVIIDTPAMDDELLDVLPYYTSCLTELGVGKRDYIDTQTWQSRITGGVNYFNTMRSNVSDAQRSTSVMVLSSKSLQVSHGPMTDLLQQTLHNVRFDESERVREILDQICARKENSITGQGHVLATALAASGMSPVANMSHRYSGLESIRNIKLLNESFKKKDEVEKLLEKFARIHQLVLRAPRQFLLVGEPDSESAMLEDLQQNWDKTYASEAFTPFQPAPVRTSVCQAWTTATQVSFCARAFPTVPSDHPDHAALTVLAGFMRNGFLHRAIREQGGAYGSGAEQDSNSASFRLYTYRDPRLLETLNDFDRAIDWVISGRHNARQLQEAILGVIAAMDKPSSPAGEARRVFFNNLFGRDLDYLSTFRQRILQVTIADLKRVAETWLLENKASTGVITSRAILESCASNDFSVINL